MKLSFGRRSGLIAASVMASGLLAFSQITPVARTDEDRIREINQQLRVERNDEVTRGLLTERAGLLTRLMEQNPRAAVVLALPAALRQDLANRIQDDGTLLEQQGEWTGPLVTSVADDFAHGRSWLLRVIRLKGQTVSVYWDSPPVDGCAPSATVRGIRLGRRIAVASGEVTADTASPCSTTGDQKTAVLLINYPSTPLTSGYTTSYVNDIFFGPAPSVTDYWREASYGTTSASGQVFGPFTLDADYTCDQQDDILQAAIQAADSTVDFTAYQRIFLILPVTVAGGCAYDGMAQLGCSLLQSPSKGSFTASATWIESITIGPNIYGALGGLLQTAIHEGGHNFGLRHASSLDYDTVPAGAPGTDGTHSEYGDPFSSMGTNPGHFAAPHKNMLGWLTEGSGWLEVESGGSWTIAPLSSQSSAGPYALRVQRGTGNSQWLWVEYRQPIGSYEPSIVDNGGPRNFGGALIHFEDPSQSSWTAYTELLDFQPVRLPNNFNTAILPAGSTWSDPYSNLTLTAGSATPSGLPVTVSYDNGCATLSSGSQSYGPLAATGQISVSAPPTCSWTAVAAAEWITFTGATSGTGAGTVGYSVTSNTSIAARTSFISISHLRVRRPGLLDQPHVGRGPDQPGSGHQQRLLHSLGCRKQLALASGRCGQLLAGPGADWHERDAGEQPVCTVSRKRFSKGRGSQRHAESHGQLHEPVCGQRKERLYAGAERRRGSRMAASRDLDGDVPVYPRFSHPERGQWQHPGIYVHHGRYLQRR
ncbi:MAG: hypothetical protein ABSB67_01175 [Bryobacteraceae bacterium]